MARPENEKVVVNVPRNDGPDDTYLVRRAVADTDNRTAARFGVERYAMLDLWTALGGDSQEFEAWIDEPRRTPADAWSQLLAAVRGEASGDTNPPAGDVLEAMARRRVRVSEVLDLIAWLQRLPWGDRDGALPPFVKSLIAGINQLAGKAETS